MAQSALACRLRSTWRRATRSSLLFTAPIFRNIPDRCNRDSEISCIASRKYCLYPARVIRNPGISRV
ncbi:hypothetical protein SAMN05421869_13065 [Nonomuraea jiangxiensis]|uniref:Uncharacterized protein n=1 Tax=Nonomuraea jiangxiensis TaxID=633440 RepID=A0A1G9MN20_9ACTN|nr:hypothetical protein SAMN05421869_13065 [Nonomuraea jiangxiensis]